MGNVAELETRVPRTRGSARLAVVARAGRSRIAHLRTAGALKLLFPRAGMRLEAILINTGGGLTGGDRLDVEARLGPGADLTITTQAAERAYRAADGVARVEARLCVAAGARLAWLPQELIVYDGAALERRLEIALAGDARLLMVEPVIFGRAAMGESLRAARIRDRITVTRDGRPLYRDGVTLEGDIAGRLRRGAVAGGARAMASLVYVGPDCPAMLGALRADLPATAGASLLAEDVLVMRFLGQDGFDLRRALLPALDRLSRMTTPASWRL